MQVTTICPVVTNYSLPHAQAPAFNATGSDDSFWIFELDAHGTILHCSAHPGEFCDPTMRGADGANFFEDVSGLESMAEMHKRFRSFLASGRPTETFTIYGGYTAIERPVKVTLTRTFQSGAGDRMQTVMMEIKGDPFSMNLGGKNGNTASI